MNAVEKTTATTNKATTRARKPTTRAHDATPNTPPPELPFEARQDAAGVWLIYNRDGKEYALGPFPPGTTLAEIFMSDFGARGAS